MKWYHTKRWAAGGLLLTWVGLVGCKKEDKTPPPLETVELKGKVLMPDGSPAKGMKLDFQPAAAGGFAGQAYTKPDGAFTTTTRGGQPGIVPGAYKVTVAPSTDESILPADYEAAKKAMPTPKTLDLTVSAQTSDITIDLKK